MTLKREIHCCRNDERLHDDVRLSLGGGGWLLKRMLGTGTRTAHRYTPLVRPQWVLRLNGCERVGCSMMLLLGHCVPDLLPLSTSKWEARIVEAHGKVNEPALGNRRLCGDCMLIRRGWFAVLLF